MLASLSIETGLPFEYFAEMDPKMLVTYLQVFEDQAEEN